MNIDPLEELLEDPDRRAKLMVIITALQILVPIGMAFGIFILILHGLGFI